MKLIFKKNIFNKLFFFNNKDMLKLKKQIKIFLIILPIAKKPKIFTKMIIIKY